MRSKLSIEILALVVIIVFGFSIALYQNTNASKRSELTSIGKLDDTERVTRANTMLQSLTEKPQESSTALISFDQLKNEDFVKSFIRDKNLIVKQVYFTIPVSKGPTTRGGFVPSDDINVAFADNKNHLLSSFQISVDSMKRTVGDKPQFEAETEKDKEFLEAYEMAKAALGVYEERLAIVKQNGLIYNGLQVEANNGILAELVSVPGVRAVEVVINNFDQKTLPMLPEGISSFTK